MSTKQIVAFVTTSNLEACRTLRDSSPEYRNALINGWVVGIVSWATLRAVCSK